jgi:hypothetical protein
VIGATCRVPPSSGPLRRSARHASDLVINCGARSHALTCCKSYKSYKSHKSMAAAAAAASDSDGKDASGVHGLDDSEMSSGNLRLLSKDAKTFELLKKNSLISTLVKTSLDTDPTATDVPIPGVQAEILEKVGRALASSRRARTPGVMCSVLHTRSSST